MFNLLFVMLGGALGAGARHMTGKLMLGWLGPTYPWGTLTVNILGGLLMGLLIGALARINASEPWRLFLAVGMLGGFTTFSSFALDFVTLYERGALLTAFGYVALSVLGAIAAVFTGMALMRAVA
jgi:CrcB protein